MRAFDPAYVGLASRARYSNQRCAHDWIFELKLRGDALKIFFQHYWSKPASEALAVLKVWFERAKLPAKTDRRSRRQMVRGHESHGPWR
jgi:hypothetical protein